MSTELDMGGERAGTLDDGTRRAVGAAREALARGAPSGSGVRRAIVGFDGFIDSVIEVVAERYGSGPEAFQRMETLTALSERIGAASGRSTNMELVVRGERYGGNGPLMAGGLAALGVAVTYVGAVGSGAEGGEIDPLFAGFASACERVIAIGAPGRTDAFEFLDGKINFNKPGPLGDVNWKRLTAIVGVDELSAMVAATDLLAVVNWSLVHGTEGVLEGLREELLPGLDRGRRPAVFVELSSGARRPIAEIGRVCAVISGIGQLTDVHFAMNRAEGERIARSLGDEATAELLHREQAGDALRGAAIRLRERLGVATLTVHAHLGAAGAWDGGEGSGWVASAHTARPKLSTGAGDHFNAGLCLGLMLGAEPAARLAMGCAVAGCYVRAASSPTRALVSALLDSYPGTA